MLVNASPPKNAGLLVTASESASAGGTICDADAGADTGRHGAGDDREEPVRSRRTGAGDEFADLIRCWPSAGSSGMEGGIGDALGELLLSGAD